MELLDKNEGNWRERDMKMAPDLCRSNGLIY